MDPEDHRRATRPERRLEVLDAGPVGGPDLDRDGRRRAGRSPGSGPPPRSPRARPARPRSLAARQPEGEDERGGAVGGDKGVLRAGQRARCSSARRNRRPRRPVAGSSSRKRGSRAAVLGGPDRGLRPGARPRFVWTTTPVALMTRSASGPRRGRRGCRSRRPQGRRPTGSAPTASRSRSAATRPGRRPAGVVVAGAGERTEGDKKPLDAGRSRTVALMRRSSHGLAGAHGSRTHPAATGATAPVLKTGAPTGTQPLPYAGWLRPPSITSNKPRSTRPRLRRLRAHRPDRADRLRRLRREARRRRPGGRAFLAGLGAAPAPPELIAGLEPPDDAAVYRLTDDLAVIGTWTSSRPSSRTRATFGAIAAANALSRRVRDGRAGPVRALHRGLSGGAPAPRSGAIVRGRPASSGRPAEPWPAAIPSAIPSRSSGWPWWASAHPDRLLRKGGARPGDTLPLTKPLGTGLLVCGPGRGGRGRRPRAAVASCGG